MKRIAIHSAPRSGSTWLGSILDSSPHVAYRYQPLFSYGHKGELTPNSELEDINHFFEDIFSTTDSFVLQKEAIARRLVPQFKKKEITHIVYKEVRYHHILKNLLVKDKKIKVIGIVRSPFAVINSWLRAPKEFKKELGWKELEEWRFAPLKNQNKAEEFNGYEKWKEVVQIFDLLKSEFPERFYLLNYNNLLQDTVGVVEDVFEFCNLKINDQTLAFISESTEIDKSDEAYSVYRNRKEDLSWRSQLSEDIIAEINSDLIRSGMTKFCL